MNRGMFQSLGFAASLAFLFFPSARAEQHRATHLGNLSTRFAPPLVVPEDLRTRFRDPRLRPDFAEILRQWGWAGRMDDLFNAALTNAISEIQIPVGSTMPFMSSREGGRPVCLRNVLWAGDLPISAYAFNFISAGRCYRCVTPKPCSNFFLEDLGPETKPVLALECSAPEMVPVGRKTLVSLTIHNTGDAGETNVSLSLPVPSGAVVSDVTAGGVAANERLLWRILDLASGASQQVSAAFVTQQIGLLVFESSANGARAKPVQSHCETKIFGIPAILLEKADDPDPVAVGDTTTYTVKVTNQGSADDSNVQLVAAIAPELAPVSSPDGIIDAQTVKFPVVPKLAPKDVPRIPKSSPKA